MHNAYSLAFLLSMSIRHYFYPLPEFFTSLLPVLPSLSPLTLSSLPSCSLILDTHHSLSRAVAPSWCLDVLEGQGMNSSPTASGTGPQPSDLLAAAGKAEIPALPLRTWSLLHTSPVPTHTHTVKIPNCQFNRTNFARAGSVLLSTAVVQGLTSSF